MQKYPKISVLIPSLGRKCLEDCLKSLEAQTVKPHEIIVETSEGSLAKIRNKVAKRATGDILSFIDDDVYCSPKWIESIQNEFSSQDIVGVSGLAIIPTAFKKQRDLFKFRLFKNFYDRFFTDGKELLPGHIMESGAWTTGASEPTCSYEGEVDFLEACNMSFSKDVFCFVKGFDESYGGVGDWSEPDLCYRIKRLGGRLWFSQNVRVWHFPSRTGVYKKREGDVFRIKNYLKFSKKWIKPNFKHSLYIGFIKSYYMLKGAKLI